MKKWGDPTSLPILSTGTNHFLQLKKSRPPPIRGHPPPGFVSNFATPKCLGCFCQQPCLHSLSAHPPNYLNMLTVFYFLKKGSFASLIPALTHSFPSQLSFWGNTPCLHHLASQLSLNLLTVWLLPSISVKLPSPSHQTPRLLALLLFYSTSQLHLTQPFQMFSWDNRKMLLLPPSASYMDFSSTCPLSVKISTFLRVFLHLSYVLIYYWMTIVVS